MYFNSIQFKLYTIYELYFASYGQQNNYYNTLQYNYYNTR